SRKPVRAIGVRANVSPRCRRRRERSPMTVALSARPWPLLRVICLMSGDALATRPRPPDAADRITEGRLVAERNGARVDVPLGHTHVKIAIDGFLAQALVSQRVR